MAFRKQQSSSMNEPAMQQMSMLSGPLLVTTLVVVVFVLLLVTIVLRAYLMQIALCLLSATCVVGVLRLWMMMDSHMAHTSLVRAKAKVELVKQHVLSESERGAVVIDPIDGTLHHFTNLPDRPTYRDGTLLSPAPVQETKLLAPPTPKDWPGLVDAGFIYPKAPYVLGFGLEDGSPLKMSSLSSLGIGGVQGSGKSTTTLLLATQSVIRYEGNIKMTVIDPHGEMRDTDDGTPLSELLEPFAPFYLRSHDLVNPTLGYGEEMATVLNIWWDEFNRRARNGIWTDYWVGLADEFAALVDEPTYGDAFMQLIVKINEQARKVGMFWIVTTQSWKASRLGGKTDLRQSIASFVLHNMAKELSRLVVPDVYAKETPKLKIGQALLYSRGQMSLGNVPHISREDAAAAIDPYTTRVAVVEEMLPYQGPAWGTLEAGADTPTTPLSAYEMEPLQPRSTRVLSQRAIEASTPEEVLRIQSLYASACKRNISPDPVALIAAIVYGRDPQGVQMVEQVLGGE